MLFKNILRYIKKSSMFSKLYLGMVLGLLLITILFVFISDSYFKRIDLSVFVNNANYFHNKYLESKVIGGDFYYKASEDGGNKLYVYDIEVRSLDILGRPCVDCIMHGIYSGVTVYFNRKGLFFAVFETEKPNEYFIFSQCSDFFEPHIEINSDLELFLIIALFFAMIFVIGGIMYVPIKNFQSKIELLVYKQEEFGLGKLSSRYEGGDCYPISELASSFNNMADEIENKVKQIHIFSQAIPHEVRTPLSRIQLATDLLRLEANTRQMSLCNDIESYINDINSLAESTMILTKLNVSDNSFYDVDKKLIDLELFLSQRISYFNSERNDIKFICHINKPVYASLDLTLSKLIFDNIIKNACLYTRDTVWVSLSKGKNGYILSVEDNGLGIPRDKVDDILKPFSRLDNEVSGFGLGLSICCAAVKRQGWCLDIKNSYLYGGANFSVIIPLPDSDMS